MPFTAPLFVSDLQIDQLLELVHALCDPASPESVLKQGVYVKREVEKASEVATKNGGEVQLSQHVSKGLLGEPGEMAAASEFEIAQKVLSCPEIAAEARKISPSTDPLVAFVAVLLSLVKAHRTLSPAWVMAEAIPYLTTQLSFKSKVHANRLGEITTVLPQVISLAKNGEKFKSGRKSEGWGVLRKWVTKYIKSHPESTPEQVWQALKKSKYRTWISADRLVEKREIRIAGRSTSWRRFQNLVSECKRWLQQEKQ